MTFPIPYDALLGIENIAKLEKHLKQNVTNKAKIKALDTAFRAAITTVAGEDSEKPLTLVQTLYAIMFSTGASGTSFDDLLQRMVERLAQSHTENDPDFELIIHAMCDEVFEMQKFSDLNQYTAATRIRGQLFDCLKPSLVDKEASPWTNPLLVEFEQLISNISKKRNNPKEEYKGADKPLRYARQLHVYIAAATSPGALYNLLLQHAIDLHDMTVGNGGVWMTYYKEAVNNSLMVCLRLLRQSVPNHQTIEETTITNKFIKMIEPYARQSFADQLNTYAPWFKLETFWLKTAEDDKALDALGIEAIVREHCKKKASGEVQRNILREGQTLARTIADYKAPLILLVTSISEALAEPARKYFRKTILPMIIYDKLDVAMQASFASDVLNTFQNLPPELNTKILEHQKKYTDTMMATANGAATSFAHDYCDAVQIADDQALKTHLNKHTPDLRIALGLVDSASAPENTPHKAMLAFYRETIIPHLILTALARPIDNAFAEYAEQTKRREQPTKISMLESLGSTLLDLATSRDQLDAKAEADALAKQREAQAKQAELEQQKQQVKQTMQTKIIAALLPYRDSAPELESLMESIETNVRKQVAEFIRLFDRDSMAAVVTAFIPEPVEPDLLRTTSTM